MKTCHAEGWEGWSELFGWLGRARLEVFRFFRMLELKGPSEVTSL